MTEPKLHSTVERELPTMVSSLPRMFRGRSSRLAAVLAALAVGCAPGASEPGVEGHNAKLLAADAVLGDPSGTPALGTTPSTSGNTASIVIPPGPTFVTPGVVAGSHGPEAQGHTSSRLVGLVDGECAAETGDWKTWNLFPGADLRFTDGKRFCAYKWVGEGEPNTDRYPGKCGGQCITGPTFGADWLAQDDTAGLPAALPGAAGEAIAEAIRNQHKQATAALDRLPTGKRYYTHLPQGIKVFVLDDAGPLEEEQDADDVDADKVGLHGETVAGWVRQTACASDDPTDNCPIWLQKRNVLGGEHGGSALSIASEIYKAVRAAEGWPAIITLALQFSPQRVFMEDRLPNSNDDVSNHQFKIAHRAIMAALNYAASNNVIVIAAAGNHDPGPDPFEGHGYWGGNVAYPAAFGAVESVWPPLGQPGPMDLYMRRLVYAAGAVAGDGSEAPSTRIGGETCLNLPAVALTPDDEAITGTSFSAAALAGAAAAVWGYAPFLPGHMLMRLLSSTAEEVPDGRQPDECEFGTGSVRRVNICKAIKEALSTTCNTAKGPHRRMYDSACEMAENLGTCPGLPGNVVATVETTDPNSDPIADTARNQTAGMVSLERNFTSARSDECGAATVFADQDKRNAIPCPAVTRRSDREDGEDAEGSPGAGSCVGCALALDKNYSLWFFGQIASRAIRSPVVRLRLARNGTTFFAGGTPDPSDAMETASAEDDGTELLAFELGELVTNEDGEGEGEVEVEQPFAVQLIEGVNPATLLKSDFTFALEEEDGEEVSLLAELPIVVVQ